MIKNRRLHGALAVGLTLSLVAAGCGGDDDEGGDTQPADQTEDDSPADDSPAEESPDTTAGDTESTTAPTDEPTATTAAPTGEEGEPQFGGSITISPGLSNIVGLDPAVGIATGCCGGTEMLLIYDSLMRFNPETGEYEPNTAESLVPNDDFTEWTLTIKEGLEFPDGTPYDAEAVVLNVERHRTTPSSQEFPVLSQLLDTVTVVDPLTVSFTMKQSWANFPVTLSAGTGMVPSPTAIAEKGENFNVDPGQAAGIGPFAVETFNPNELLVLTKKSDYWNGDVYLDEVRSVLVVGSDAQVQAVETGSLQGAMVMTPEAIPTAEDSGLSILNFPYFAGNLTIMNGGQLMCNGGLPEAHCAGEADGTVVDLDTPTADPRVRRAVALATDRELISERVYNGTLETYATMIPPGHRFDPGVEGIEMDLEEASRLVEEVKAEGWDGTIRLVTGVPSETSMNLLQVYKTLLDSIGMNAQIETDIPFVQVVVDKNFDVYPAFAWGTSEDRVFEGLYGSLRNYRYGYASPEMDDALADLGAAGSTEEVQAAMTRVQEIMNEDVPAVPVGAGYRNFVYSPNLNNVQGSAFQIVDLRKAWLEQ